MKKKICIIYTGGTIGMEETAYGYAPAPGYMKKTLGSMQELKDPEIPDYDLIEYSPLLDSSNITVDNWNQIGADIRERYFDYDGFVVMHGTDTMAYTASALSFMLQGLSKPVILTGSQIPLCKVRNDARENLITSMMIAADYGIPEVCIYFGGKLIRGNRSTKVSSDTMIAFDSPNYEPLAEAGVNITINQKQIRREARELNFCPFTNNQIAVLKIFPGIQFEIFENIMTDKLKGIVIEAFGAGNIPQNDDSMLRMLQKAKENGTYIIVCTQCHRGTATIGKYETSKNLAEAGALCGFDMTVEAAVTKLYYLLSRHQEEREIKLLMETDIRGELTRDA
ncbi:asparaginase [Aminipila butyrica]|uniref:asparaginase n=1 Tax=Aminipila butyrica TaxID=433296 RepID=A0A858BYH5_9FIRM|nr:asparaginase [Aminipila butyrica]QIB70269.1 asparaginase [Aminipila butyrica]